MITVHTAGKHVDAISHALHHSKDPGALIAAVRAAQKHVAAMKRVARKSPKHSGSSYQVDSSGTFDPKMYELGNLLVDAKKYVRNIKKRHESEHRAMKTRFNPVHHVGKKSGAQLDREISGALAAGPSAPKRAVTTSAHPTLFLRHSSGATHKLSERVAGKLQRELAAGRGGPEITRLVENGYNEFLGPDGDDWDLSGLTADMIK